MTPEKMYEMTQHLQQNNSELSDFLGDLGNWSEKMKEKEKSLDQTLKKDELPPIRNAHLKKKLRKKSKPKKTDTVKKIRGNDYRSWDKFDVDAACEEIDNAKPESDASYETDDEWEVQRKKTEANYFKEQGNQLVKEGQFDLAIEAYTKGILADPENIILPANRALVLIKQEKYAAAIIDCTTSILLDSTYVKAFYRRATAYIKLGHSEKAKIDLEKCLELEPANRSARNELTKLKEDMRTMVKPSTIDVADDEADGILKPVFKKASERSKKPLHRVIIQEVGLPQPMKPLMQESSFISKSKIEEISSESAIDETPVFSRSKPVAIVAPTSPRPQIVAPPPPQTTFQFQVDMKELKSAPSEVIAEYISKISPSKLPSLVGHSFDSDMLSSMLSALLTFKSDFDTQVVEYLCQLGKVKRFATVLSFASDHDVKTLKDVFKQITSNELCSCDQLTQLKAAYNL